MLVLSVEQKRKKGAFLAHWFDYNLKQTNKNRKIDKIRKDMINYSDRNSLTASNVYD